MSTYTDLFNSNNFTNLTAVPVDPVSDVYDFSFAFLTSSTVSTVSDGSDTDYYTGTGTPGVNAGYISDFVEVTSSVKTAVNIILETSSSSDLYSCYFADVANVSFTNSTGDTGSTAPNVDIAIGSLSSGGPHFTGSHSGNYAWTDLGTLAANGGQGGFGDVWLNAAAGDVGSWNSATPGTLAFYVLLHELGHSMGLQDLVTTGGINSQQYSVESEDQTTWYANNGMTNNTYDAATGLFPSGLQMDDIEALQSLYGANYATRQGNTIYGLGHGFGPTGSTDPTQEFIYTIWAGGGINVIDASSYSGAATINLNQGQFSSIGYGDAGVGAASNNVSIAYGAIIQNAIGTQGADTFIGNQWNNVLAGSGTGGDNTFYSDQMVSPLDTPGINWSYQAGTALTETADGSLAWDDPNYITPAPNTGPGSMKEDVLIGYGDNNTFYSGIGNNVIDGGYNKLDINAATAAINTSWGDSASPNYWDSAEQFTGTNNISGAALANISDSSANTGNFVDILAGTGKLKQLSKGNDLWHAS